MSLHVIYSVVLEDVKHFSTSLFSSQGGLAGSREAESNFSFLPLHLLPIVWSWHTADLC